MATASSVQYSGIWNLSSQANAKGAGTWTAAPGAPTIGTATAGNASASVTFTAPTDPGVPATITSYTATSSPGGFTGTGSASPITVSGLTNGTAYTFTVTATNSTGTGPASAASNSVTPALPAIFSWGKNITYGPLGLGNTTNYSSPKQVGSNAWSKISAGRYFSIAISTNGSLWSWGQNVYGALGLNNTTYYSSPKQIGALTNWLSFSAGLYFVTAIKTDKTLWTWGQNNFGQLGISNTTNYSSPKQVGSSTDWVSIAAGFFHAVATKTDGTLWTWGRNQFGQLGLGTSGTYTAKSSPTQVGSLTTWSSVVLGGNYQTLAIKTDGTLWSWGNNSFGQLGLGNTTYYSSPKQVGALTTWASIAGNGQYFTLATKTNNSLYSWGINSYGQLGLNNVTYYSSPKQVGSLFNWSKIATGHNHALSIKTDGTLWTWGLNNSGQLGLNTSGTNYSSPMQVGSLTTWLSTAGGAYHSLSIAST